MKKIILLIVIFFSQNCFSQNIKGITIDANFNVFCLSFTDMYMTHVVYDQNGEVRYSQLYRISNLELDEINNKYLYKIEVTSGYSAMTYYYILELEEIPAIDEKSVLTYKSNFYIFDKETGTKLRYGGSIKPFKSFKQN